MKKNTKGARVTIVTVTYNSVHVLPKMLESVPAGTPIIVVDNASTEKTDLRRMAFGYGAQLVENEENVGFGVACNMGASLAETEFLLFLNPDAYLFTGALESLISAADHYPNVSAMNPRILDSHGEVFFKRKSHLMPRSEWMRRGGPERDSEVAILSGAALFVRKVYFDFIGGFDRDIFLFHEDDDLALRLKRDCGPLMLITSAKVGHGKGSSSIRSSDVAALKAWHMGISRVYAARKHGISFAGTRALIEALFGIISPLMLLSSRKRAKHIAFLKGVVTALRKRVGVKPITGG